jgi:hypothetical protein
MPIAVSALVIVVGACSRGGADEAPSRLLDGSPAEPPPVELQGVDRPAVLTRVIAADPNEPSDVARTCLAVRPEQPGAGRLVVRVGVRSRSVTFVDETGNALVACDGAAGSTEGTPGWCSAAHGRLADGVLRDPRLTFGCLDATGAPVAQLWVTPTRSTAFVAVERRGYVEVYPVAEELPVRVAAGDVEPGGSRAVASVSEHGRDGRLLRRYRLEAAVAG